MAKKKEVPLRKLMWGTAKKAYAFGKERYDTAPQRRLASLRAEEKRLKTRARVYKARARVERFKSSEAGEVRSYFGIGNGMFEQTQQKKKKRKRR